MPPFNRIVPVRKRRESPPGNPALRCPQNLSSLSGDVGYALWSEACAVLGEYDAWMDRFLHLWAEYMDRAGYLDFTTAKRQDCIQSVLFLLEPMLEHFRQEKYPRFEDLIRNADGWADNMVKSGLRHWQRGVSVTMFLGCFKTFIWALQDALDCLPGSDSRGKTEAVEIAKHFLGMYGHSFEVIWVDSILDGPFRDGASMHEAENRLLTLEKCRFENVFNTTSDGVLIMDEDCRITSVNATLSQYAGNNLRGEYIWDALGMDGIGGKAELFASFPPGTQVETTLFHGGLFFRMGIVSLGQVSLAHRHEYIACLSNITQLVRQREFLKAEVDKQTAELQHEKQQLEEMNITLRNVIKSVNEERKKSHEDISGAIRNFLYPAMRKVVSEGKLEARDVYARMLTDQIERFLSPSRSAANSVDPESAEANLEKLTLTELKICQLAEAGHSSKKIAELLGTSPETVKTHRRSIRRKLNLRGHGSQLGAFLLNRKA